ncbi:hypothetical protein BC833DRAFT_621127 [Globomyces pollinis-pini]|nr:hypothetical protein BC833DRAFT_621127 [Globomyces pollinis-pini]
MSVILTEWLKSDLNINRKLSPLDMEKEFSSGYMFGKLLSNLGVQDDFHSSYINGTTVDAYLKNYTSLEATLREKLGIKLSSNTSYDLINGKPGVATHLLYQIKSATTTLPPEKLQSINTAKKPKFDSYPSSPIDNESTNFSPLIELGKVLPFDQQSKAHFETALKQKLKRATYVSKFGKIEPIIKKKELPPLPKMVLNVPPIEEPIKMEKVHSIKKEEPVGNTIPIQKKIPKIEQATETISKIEEFEMKHTSYLTKLLQKDSDSELMEIQPLSSKEVSQFIADKNCLASNEHLSLLRKSLEQSVLQQEKESKLYLERIKSQRLEADNSRRERERERKKMLLAHHQIQQNMEKEQMEELIQQKLLRQSKQERRIAEQLMQVRHEKEVIRENRIFRDEQYAEYRQKEYEEALQREHELFQNATEEYRQHVFLQLEQHQEIINQKKQRKHERNTKHMKATVNQLLELVFRVVDYKTLNDRREVPIKKMKEIKNLFIHHLPIEDYEEIPLEKDAIPKSCEVEVVVTDQEGVNKEVDIPKAIKLLDSQEFEDYLNYSGSWYKPNEDGLIRKNESLAVAVEDIIKLTTIPDEVYQVTPMPVVPLRIAIIGKRFSGKQTQAKLIAAKYNMTILRLDDLVKDAISQADIMTKKQKIAATETGKESKKMLSKQQIGAKLQLVMLEGQSPDDSLLVGLVAEALSQEPENPGGYILLDFPKTRQQAQLLEREMSGYEDPKPAKKGELKRAKDRVNASQQKNRSLIAPYDMQSDGNATIPISGLDAVLLFDVANEIAISRAAGQTVDPITGQGYHIEFNPPPETVPGLMERLAPVEDSSRAMSQLQYHLAAFEEEEEGLKEWLHQFKTLQVVDSNLTGGEIEKTVDGLIANIINKVNSNQLQKDVNFSLGVVENKADATNPEKTDDKNSTPFLDDQFEKQSNNRESNNSANIKRERLNSSVGKSNVKLLDLKKTAVAPAQITDLQPLDISISNHITRSLSADGRKLPSKEIGEILYDQWTTIESSYTETLKFSFRSLRRQRQEILQYFYDTKFKYSEFLKRPDTEQELIDIFQTEYNSIEEDFRIDNDVKAELHQRVEELREKLWEIADKRRDEAEQERISIIDDKWVEDQSFILANIFISMIQVEADRFLATRQFLLDYYKDTNFTPLSDGLKKTIKIPFLAQSNQPPIEIGIHLIAASEAASNHRKDVLQTAAVQVNSKAPTKNTGNSKATSGNKNAPTTKAAQEASIKQAQIPTIGEKDMLLVDSENINFPDMQNAIDYLFNTLATPDYAIEPVVVPEVKEKKLATPDHNATKDEPEKLLPECQKAIEIEELILRQRCDRIISYSIESFRELRTRALEVYLMMDDWIGVRYRSEIDAAKDLMHLIKEAIEAEAKLPNLLVLEGEKLKIDYTTLVYQPEEEPRPESPLEKSLPEQFTILQLRNLGKQLTQMAPNGIIQTKVLTEFLIKTGLLALSLDGLPDGYVNADAQQLQQVVGILDPYETGYINWRKFIMFHARLLPVGIQCIEDLKVQLQGLPSYNSGVVSNQDFKSTKLWFEPETYSNSKRVFDRPAKLKAALLDIFGVTAKPEPAPPSTDFGSSTTTNQIPSGESTIINPEGMSLDLVDVKDFMYICCCDEVPQMAIEKAFKVAQDDPRGCTKQQLFDIYQQFLHIVPPTHRIETSIEHETLYPLSNLNALWQQFGIQERITFDQLSMIVGGTSGNEYLLNCPLYQLEDLTLGASSRPSSGKATGNK